MWLISARVLGQSRKVVWWITGSVLSVRSIPPSPPTGMQQCEEKVRFSHKCSILLLCLPKPVQRPPDGWFIYVVGLEWLPLWLCLEPRHGNSVKRKAIGCFRLPSRRPWARQDEGLGRMERIGGLGKHMTQTPSQTLLVGWGFVSNKGTIPFPGNQAPWQCTPSLSSSWQHCTSNLSRSSKLSVHVSCQVPSGHQASCLVPPSW